MFMKLLKFILLFLFPVMHVGAQERAGVQKITGRVISASDYKGIPDVTVRFKDQKTVTISDRYGNFALESNGKPDTLICSHISYKTKFSTINNESEAPLQIELYELLGDLDPVILNTGFQQIPQERSTGSFSFIDNKSLSLKVGTSILDKINGLSNAILFDDTKISGANRKLNINIRGLSTINGSQDPLIILNNFPYEGDLANINPDDVENITILKDAAAASIWGTKAGNGVIVITTKKANFNQPMKVDFNSNVIIREKPDLFSVPQMDIGDYIDVEQMLFNKGFFNSQINSISMPALSPAVEIFLKRRNGLISPQDSALAIDELKKNDIRRDYDKYMYRSAVTQAYSIHLSGGSDKNKYIFSGGYDHTLGNLYETNDRLNIGMNNTFKVSEKLQVTVGGQFTNANSKSGFTAYSLNGFAISNRNIPYIKLADEEGFPLAVARYYRASYVDTVGGGRLLDWKYYPLEENKHRITNGNSRSLIASLGVQYKIFNSLSLNFSYQYESQEAKSQTLADMESFEARDLINSFTQIDPVTGALNYIAPMGSVLYKYNNSLEAHNARAQFDFRRSWKAHNVTALFGSEIRQAKNKDDADKIYGYNDDLLTVSNIDFVNPYPSYITGYPQYFGNGLSFSENLNRFVSLFTNAAYTLKDRYTISGSARKDASNLFGLKTNDKWSPFWSAGAGWNLSKESFYHSNLFPYLKLRVTYGYSGIVDQSKSAVTVIGYAGSNQYIGTPQAIISQYANDELSWEKVSHFNVGIDFKSKREIIKGSIEYYIKRGFNLFGITPFDYTAGLSTKVLTRNIADMRGNGLDVSLQTHNIDRAFKWTTNLLFSYNKSITTDYYISPGQKYLALSGRVISPLKGKSLYAVMSYKWAGLDENGNPQGYLDKKLSKDYLSIFNSLTSPDSLVYNGPAMPEFFGSVRNAFSWRGFALDVNIIYKLGYFFRKSTITYDKLISSGIGDVDFAKRWQQPGDELLTSVPSLTYPINTNAKRRDQFYTASEVTAVNAGQIRLQFINLSYDFQNTLFRKEWFRMLQVYVNASNLGLLWTANKQGIDPDFQNTWPTPKTFALGIKAKF